MKYIISVNSTEHILRLQDNIAIFNAYYTRLNGNDTMLTDFNDDVVLIKTNGGRYILTPNFDETSTEGIIQIFRE